MEENETAAGDPGPRAVVGLGNPGERYRDTRHNLGFRVVRELARRRGVRVDRLECNALVGALVGEGDGLLLVLPQTYMNRSGHALRCLRERRGLQPDRTLVVYDEVQLPLGRLRLRPGGSPGGHRGMESVVENLRTDQVPRLRLGCAGEDGPPSGDDLVDYVLSPFDEAERATAEAMIEQAADACEAWLEEGAEAAMNRFNG
ncbi:MAG: aminoacyl-tRNA hydrolase [Acidobacteriota bacterium]|jgi:PTH1 family peptidyl-tRNA hydrolase